MRWALATVYLCFGACATFEPIPLDPRVQTLIELKGTRAKDPLMKSWGPPSTRNNLEAGGEIWTYDYCVGVAEHSGGSFYSPIGRDVIGRADSVSVVSQSCTRYLLEFSEEGTLAAASKDTIPVEAAKSLWEKSERRRRFEFEAKYGPSQGVDYDAIAEGPRKTLLSIGIDKRVRLKLLSGQSVEGDIIKVEENSVWLKIKPGIFGSKFFYLKEIESVESIGP